MALAMFIFGLVGLAFPSDHGHGSGISDAAILFVQEAVGGAVIGLFLGGWYFASCAKLMIIRLRCC